MWVGEEDDLIAFDPDLEKDGMVLQLDTSSLMSNDSSVDVEVRGVLKLVEVSYLVLSLVWLQRSLEFFRGNSQSY